VRRRDAGPAPSYYEVADGNGQASSRFALRRSVAFGAPTVTGRGVQTANVFDLYEGEKRSVSRPAGERRRINYSADHVIVGLLVRQGW
jgi:hypothetical protein